MKTVQEMYLDKLRQEEMPRLKAEARANVEAELQAEERDRWREVLRKMLTDKFGRVEPEHEHRIEAASLDDLQHLITRAVTSDTLEAVFAPRDA